MRRTLTFYVIAAVILQFLVFHILDAVALQEQMWFAHNEYDQLPILTRVSLHFHPLLNLLNFGTVLFAAFAIYRKLNERVLIHIIGITMLTGMAAVVYQAFCFALMIGGTIIGKLK